MAYPESVPVLDFTIVDTHNLMTLGIGDSSVYPTGFIITNPVFEIIPPSFPKVVVPYSPGGLLILNSNTLNITCSNSLSLLAELPDGIWSIKQSVAPMIDHNIERSFLRTNKIEQKFGTAFLRTDIIECNLDVRTEQMKVIDQIWFYIQGAISAANQCNFDLAMKLYREANRMLDNFLRDRCRGAFPTLSC